jgi:hypothetical protein
MPTAKVSRSVNSSGERNVQESNLPLLEGVHRVADGLAPTSQMTFQDSGERRARSSAPRGTAALSKRAADHSAFTLHAEGGGLEPHAGETHTRFERGLAPSPGHLPDARAEDRLRARGDAEGGGLEPHTWRCPPGSSRRRRLAGSPSIVVQGGSRTRTPARAPRFERGVSTVSATWTSQCPGRESNSHARLERRLLRPVCLPVVPPPGRECGARGEGRTRMGREARWPLEPVCLPGGSTTRA